MRIPNFSFNFCFILAAFSFLTCAPLLAADSSSSAGARESGWQLEAFSPAEGDPAISWDCFSSPDTTIGFANSYVEMLYGHDGCKIASQPGSGVDASLTAQCDGMVRAFEFKRTTRNTIGIREVETDQGGGKNEYLTLVKQCDASVEFDCSPNGKAAWKASHSAQAANFSCGEAPKPMPPSNVDYGFPVHLKTYVVIPNRDGDSPDSGLPELCNWYAVDGEEFCYTPTDLERHVDNPHALSLANIAIDLNMGETDFSGTKEYCDDVRAIASQMRWLKKVQCSN